jgi:hypothetical protein
MSNGMSACAQGVRGAAIKLQPVMAFCRKIFVVLGRCVPAQPTVTKSKAWGERQDLVS